MTLEPKFREHQADNKFLSERARLSIKLNNLQHEINALTTHIQWNRCRRLKTESSRDLEQLLDQLAVNPNFANIKYPLILPSIAEQNSRLKSLSLQTQACNEASNIMFTAVLKEHDSESCKTEYSLEGKCYNETFKVFFVSEKYNSTPKITNLKIEAKQFIPSEIDTWINNCEKSRDLVGFFRIYSRYVAKAQERRQLFIDIKEKHSQFIQEYIPEKLIVFYFPGNDWIQLTFFYQFSLSENERKVSEKIELLPKIVAEDLVPSSSQADILLDIPEKFLHLVALKGIVDAIGLVISALWE